MNDKQFGFAAYEYLEGFRESLQNLTIHAEELLQLVGMGMISGDNYLSGFRNKCNLTLGLILEYSERNLRYLNKVEVLGKKEFESTFSSYVAFDSYSEALRSLEKAINQRLASARYDIGFFPEFSWRQSEARISNAIDKLVEYLTMLFFDVTIQTPNGKAQDKDPSYRIIPMTIFGDSPKHETTSYPLQGHENVLLFMVNMPNPDVHRFRYWTSLGHEIAHVKLSKTIQSSQHKWTKYIVYPAKGQQLYDRILQDLAYKIGEAYSNSKQFSEKYKQNTPGFAKLIHKQINEMIADYSSLVIFGLPSMCTLLCSSGNPNQGLDDIYDHPPLPVRMNYMLSVLRSFRSKTKKYEETLSELEQEWVSMSAATCNLDQYQNFLDSYNAAVKKYSNEVFEFASHYLIINSKPVEPKVWDTCIDMYENQKPELVETCNNPVSSLVRAWAKRWITYKKLCTTGKGTFHWFMSWHKTETKIYGQLINELNRL